MSGLQALKSRLSKTGKLPSRKSHKLTQYKECKELNLSEQQCYQKVTFTTHRTTAFIDDTLFVQISNMLDEFFRLRSYMWPTFAGNGFDISHAK
jgi:hypothetical protein